MSPVARNRRPPPTRRRKSTTPSARDKQVVAAFQRFVGEIFRLNGQLLATAEGMSRTMRITPARWQTIATLRHEPLTVAQIGRQLGLRRQSVQHNINLLVAQGLAELQPNPEHRRASLIALTTRGYAVMDKLHGLQSELTVRFLGNLPLTAPDLEAMTVLLETLRQQGAQGVNDDLPSGS